eukprot:366160-Chlamydomonas_euryale.AAC.1
MVPLERDPVKCHARNTHGRTLSDVRALAGAWEDPPAVFTLLDFGPMLSGGGAAVCTDGDAGGGEPASARPAEPAAENGEGAAGRRAGGDESGDEAAADDDTETVVAGSRWSAYGDADSAARGRAAKRGLSAAQLSDQQLLSDLNSELDGLAGGAPTAAPLRSILRGAPSSAGPAGKRPRGEARRVSWPDEPLRDATDGAALAAATETTAAPAARPLAQVYELEGLGPAKGDTALQYMLAPGGTMAQGGIVAGGGAHGLPASHSFAEQVRPACLTPAPPKARRRLTNTPWAAACMRTVRVRV